MRFVRRTRNFPRQEIGNWKPVMDSADHLGGNGNGKQVQKDIRLGWGLQAQGE